MTADFLFIALKLGCHLLTVAVIQMQYVSHILCLSIADKSTASARHPGEL